MVSWRLYCFQCDVLSVLRPNETVLNVLGSRYEASRSERVHYIQTRHMLWKMISRLIDWKMPYLVIVSNVEIASKNPDAALCLSKREMQMQIWYEPFGTNNKTKFVHPDRFNVGCSLFVL